MALAALAIRASAAHLRCAAMDGRGPRRANGVAPRRTGLRRYAPILPLCAADRRPRRPGGSGMPAAADTTADLARRHGGDRRTRRRPTRLRLPCAAVELAAPVPHDARQRTGRRPRSEEHTSELQSLMRISYAVFCLKKKKNTTTTQT